VRQRIENASERAAKAVGGDEADADETDAALRLVIVACIRIPASHCRRAD
jgi:hypothetical protein